MTFPAGAKYGKTTCGKDGSLMRVCRVDDGSGSGTGNLWASYQAPGDASASAFVKLLDETGAAISVEDEPHDVTHVAAPSSPWLYTAVESGNTAPTNFLVTHEADPHVLRLPTF